MNLKQGTTLERGKYRIDGVLGQGGFGITYLGEQIYLGRKVAIKEFFMDGLCVRDGATQSVSAPADTNKGVVERFRRKFIKEAQNIARLKHRGIVPIIDIFEENGTAYYVMEHLAGGSLAGKVQQGALPEPLAVRYISQVAAALDYVHSQRVMHLDVKPANILLGEEDNAVLIDFGLAKQYDVAGQQTSTTPVGISHGYAPLEQYKQGGVEQFSPATDVYSLGATLYKLVTGATPPEASDVMNNGLPAFPSTVSTQVQKAIIAAMQPAVKARPQSIKEFMRLVESEEVRAESEENTVISSDSEKYARQNDKPANRVVSSVSEKSQKDSLHDKGGVAITVIVAALVVALCVIVPLFFTSSGEDKSEQNGHSYVDLGLPSGLKWATCNVGASTPEGYGDYYAWGEIETKSDYSTSTSTTYGKQMSDIGGNATYDVARKKWGSTWRLPTQAEFEELLDNCTWVWTTQSGVNGYKVTSKKNGNSIFLPAAGCRNGTSLNLTGSGGYYWSSTPDESDTSGACNLYFGSGYHSTNWYGRSYGHSVRPVSE